MNEPYGKQLNHSDHKPTEKKNPVVLLLDNIKDPKNVGSMFRIADAMGVQKVYLTGNAPTPPNKNINKTSRSTEKSVDFEYQLDALDVISQLKSDCFSIISLEVTSSSIDLADVACDSYDRVCIVVGAESEGVSDSILRASDLHVHIPMYGQNSSMNVAVACGIALYTFLP